MTLCGIIVYEIMYSYVSKLAAKSIINLVSIINDIKEESIYVL